MQVINNFFIWNNTFGNSNFVIPAIRCIHAEKAWDAAPVWVRTIDVLFIYKGL
jgi:hypothetical protein